MIILFSGTQGYLDDLQVEQIRAFEDGLYPYLDSAQSQLLSDIATKKALDDDLRNRIHAALKEYKANFLSEQEGAKGGPAKPAAEPEKKKEQEQKAERSRWRRTKNPWPTFSIYGAASAACGTRGRSPKP